MNDDRRDWIALTLAVGICTALNLLVLAVAYGAVTGSSDVEGGLSENATQILTGWGGGIIGVIGALVGYKAGMVRGESNGKAKAEAEVNGERSQATTR